MQNYEYQHLQNVVKSIIRNHHYFKFKLRNFLNAINKAKESCETNGEAVSDHFVDVNKMIKI